MQSELSSKSPQSSDVPASLESPPTSAASAQQFHYPGLTDKQFQEILDSVLKESPVVGPLLIARAEALTEVLLGRLTIAQAAKTFNTTFYTLQKYLKLFKSKAELYKTENNKTERFVCLNFCFFKIVVIFQPS